MPSGLEKLTLLRALFLTAFWVVAAHAEPVLRQNSDANWTLPFDWFGGFSGMELDAEGDTATLITDKGTLARIALIRSNGKITGIQLLGEMPLRHRNGRKLAGLSTDAEGLAVAPDGTAYLSFEHRHRVAILDPKTGITSPLPVPPSFEKFEPNSGLEALAISPQGTLYTLPERSGGKRTPFKLYAYDASGWRVAHRIPRRGPFRPVGADFDVDGLLYLLERAATPLGFRSRIRRFDLTSKPMGEEAILSTGPARFDNLEALSVWRDRSGSTRLTMISDNNFFRIQRTQIVEYTLTE